MLKQQTWVELFDEEYGLAEKCYKMAVEYGAKGKTKYDLTFYISNET